MEDCEATFMDDFPNQIRKPNSYPLSILLTIYEAIQERIDKAAKGEGFGVPGMSSLQVVEGC